MASRLICLWLLVGCGSWGCASWHRWMDRAPAPEQAPSPVDAERLRVDAYRAAPGRWALEIANDGDEPLSFADARIAFDDDGGRPVPILASASTLLGPGVVVAPHARWSGLIVLAEGAPRGALHLRWRGARFGPGPSTSVDITMRADCDVTLPAELGVLVDAPATLPASSHVARRAEKLRVLGDFLIGAGVAGTVAITAALGVSEHSRYAAAGTGMLGLAVIGGVLEYVGWRHERRALREQTGVRARCASRP